MRLWLFLAGIFFTSAHVLSQSHSMGFSNDVIHPELLTKRLLANKRWIAKNPVPVKSLNPVYVPVKFHLVAQSNGAGRIDVSQLLNELCEVNSQFSEIGITFYIKDGFNELNHTPSYEVPRSGTAVSRMISEMDKNAMNVFITQNADQTGIDNGTSLGYYNGSADFIVVRKSQIGTSASTLAHEIGHYFSLRHPHYGWEDDPWTLEQYGKMVTVTMVSSSQTGFKNVRVELVDRSNCEISADLLCDTPPDYNFGLTWPNDCPPFDEIVMDRNGDTIQPMENNFMSYFIGCKPYEFTNMQGQVMLADYLSNAREDIRSDYIPDFQEIQEQIELLAPGFNDTVNVLEPVQLGWTAPAGNGIQYSIVIKGGSQEFRLFTSQTTITVENLEPNRTYTWSVHPFNDTGGCADRETGIFRTTDRSTAIIDPEFISGVSLFPNPISDQSEISLQFFSGKKSISSIRIYDTAGNLHYLESYPIFQGENKWVKNLDMIDKGMYFLCVYIQNEMLIRRFVKL